MKTLIAVEDHATRSLLERAITSRLHRVRHAIDFDTALKMCAEERPALVLLDWRLSTSRSPTLLERIRALRDGDQMLVFAVLPPGGAQEAQAALEAGANDYIPMPVDPRRTGISRFATATSMANPDSPIDAHTRRSDECRLPRYWA